MMEVNQVNPFVHKLTFTPAQKLRMCVCGLVLLPVRLLVAFVCITTAGLLAMLGQAGLKPEDLDKTPFTGWRLFIRKAICVILRFMYVCLGFIVRIDGEQAKSSEAPILVVAPHSSFFDSLPVVLMGAPSVVAKAETTSIPFWGDIIKMSQPVLVHRSDTNSRQNTIKQISERAEGEGWQQVLIFPEGTCTNRQCLITFRLGAFHPCVPVQPVIIRYDNNIDTITWTWEGIGAVRSIVYSLCQFYCKCSIEYLDPYVPSEEEKKNPILFANNVRRVMADKLGVETTDSNYYDYLKIEKCQKTLKKIQKLQRKLEMPIIDLTKDISSQQVMSEELSSRLSSLGEASEEVKTVEELCGGGTKDLRNLRLIALIATSENSFESFLENIFTLYDSDLGEERISIETMESILQTLLYLTSKEAKEMKDATENNGTVTKDDLKQYLLNKKPNFVKLVRCWEGGLSSNHDILAISAQLSKRMERVADAGSHLLSSGLNDGLASVKASREKMSEAFSSAVTSIHKRTGSRTETVSQSGDSGDKKHD